MSSAAILQPPSEVAPAAKASDPRTGKDLIDATRPFAIENRARSVWYVASTFALLCGAIAAAALLPIWPARAAAAVLAGLLVVRAFILYHDFMHGAILRGSRPARWLFNIYGVLVLTPPRVWRETHNYHHAHTAKIVGSHVGSYMMLTTDMYRRATLGQRIMYRLLRHPLNIACAYLTIFLFGMCVSPFLRNPRKNWDSALAIVVHIALVSTVSALFGPSTAFYSIVLPLVVACAMGGYLFYAQHNFPDVYVQPRESWSYTRAALESSSFMPMGPVMTWFTGNIGYHHVHHLNPSIPFYRLPEAMDAIPELQNPGVTTLRPRDVLACFRLKLWDPVQGRMVGYAEATRSDRAA